MLVTNKTFDEIRAGDAASVQRTLQAGDVRAWAAAFGDAGLLAGAAERHGAAGIVTAILTSLVGSALPGPGSSIRSTAVQVQRRAADRCAADGEDRGAGKAAGHGAHRPRRRMHRPGGQPIATAVLEVSGADDASAREVAEHRLDGLLERCRGLKPMLTGVVHPCSADALAGAVEAAAGRS